MTEREKREKVIRGLEWCMNEKHDCYREKGCPYENEGDDIGCKYALHRDAIALLRVQEPRVMTLEELPVWDGAFLVESRRSGDFVWASWYAEYELYGDTVVRMVDIDGGVDDRPASLYGYEWRCWTARPTEAEREATLWN